MTNALGVVLPVLVVVLALFFVLGRMRRARKARSAVASVAPSVPSPVQSLDLTGGRHRAPVRSSRWVGSRGSM